MRDGEAPEGFDRYVEAVRSGMWPLLGFEAFDERDGAPGLADEHRAPCRERGRQREEPDGALADSGEPDDHFETLFVQADDLTRSRVARDAPWRSRKWMNCRKKAAWQMETMKQSREDLEVLRTQREDSTNRTPNIAQLRDKLGSDRQALEGFAERMAAMRTRA